MIFVHERFKTAFENFQKHFEVIHLKLDLSMQKCWHIFPYNFVHVL